MYQSDILPEGWNQLEDLEFPYEDISSLQNLCAGAGYPAFRQNLCWITIFVSFKIL